MKKLTQVLSYILVAAIASAVTMFIFVTPQTQQPADTTKLTQLQTLILNRFIGEKDQTALEDAAAHAMVEALGDEWSRYIPADEYAAYAEQMANSYVGVGITIAVREDGLGFTVEEVTAGGPAYDAGLKPGDILTKVAGQSVGAMTTAEARELVRGEVGTFVEMTVLRDGQEMTFSVERRQINSVVATYEMLDGNVGYVTIANFDERCADETIAAIEALLEQGAEYLLFDVRYNPGGYASEMVEVLDYLLPEGPLFKTVDYAGNESLDSSDAECLDIPMAVLVNMQSYSAAEFFAAALSEYDAAVVVGEQTYGKGYFQRTYLLSDGSAVGLSVGKYYTPQGKNLAGVGITPDIPVEVDEETDAAIYYGTLAPMEDPQILAALEALKSE